MLHAVKCVVCTSVFIGCLFVDMFAWTCLPNVFQFSRNAQCLKVSNCADILFRMQVERCG